MTIIPIQRAYLDDNGALVAELLEEDRVPVSLTEATYDETGVHIRGSIPMDQAVRLGLTPEEQRTPAGSRYSTAGPRSPTTSSGRSQAETGEPTSPATPSRPWQPTPEQEAKINQISSDFAKHHGITTEEAIRRLRGKPEDPDGR